MVKFIIKFRLAVIVFSLLAGIAAIILLPKAESDPEIRNYVPPGLSSRIATDSIEKEFGIQDMVVLIFSDSSILTQENLEIIRKADRGISRLGNTSHRVSPFTIKMIKGDDGMIVTENLLEDIPQTDEEISLLKNKIKENELTSGMVFSGNLRHAAIMLNIDTEEGEFITLHKIDSILNSLPQHGMEIRKGGLPYIRKYIIDDVKHDAIVVVPISVAVLLLVLMLMLGSWKKAMMPFSVVLLSTAICMSIIPLAGWKISIITMLVPVILIAVANNYGIYLVSFRSGSNNNDKGAFLREMFSSLRMPVLFSGLTTIAGLLGLLLHSIIPARQTGLLSATGVTIALILSLLLIPAFIISGKPGGRQVGTTSEKRRSWRFTDRIISSIINHPGRILAILIALVIIVSGGSFLLKTETNQENFFPASHPVKESSRIINDEFGGSQTVSVMIEGDIKDPRIMKSIDSLTGGLKEISGVGDVYSVSLAVKEISKVLFLKNEEGYNRIPDSREAIAQFFELYYMGGDRDDFSQLINPSEDKAHILVKLAEPDYTVIKNVRDKISEMRLPEARIVTGGFASIMSDFASSVIKGQVSSLAFALFTVFVLLAIVFRSIKGGMLGSVPLLLSILLLFGFMGLTGIPLDSATALLSSIMIGVGVDFTIQYIWFLSREINKTGDFAKATESSLRGIGSSILTNGLSVMAGFSALLFSGFTSIRFFGWLTIISIGSCLVGALVIVPAIILVAKPEFIKQITHKRK